MRIQMILMVFTAMIFASVAGAEQASSLKSPNVSANSLFLYRNSSKGNDRTGSERNGLDLQEAEVAFFSDVDPYSRLYVLLSIHPEYTPTLIGAFEQTWVLEPEELFAELTEIPLTTMKLGKFKAALGKHNQLHTHAFPFVDAPLENTVLLGDEGLNDVGLSAAILFPWSWFSELTLQALRGEGENSEFRSSTPNDAVGVAHWKNLWDLSDDLTFELGTSYAYGMNFTDRPTSFAGADLTMKWRPAEGGRYRSGILALEYLGRTLGLDGGSDEHGRGFNVWGQYQFGERWAALARYDQLKVDNTTRAYTAGLTFNATEFSSYRFELSQREGPLEGLGDFERKFFAQANFTIGAHPAHTY